MLIQIPLKLKFLFQVRQLLLNFSLYIPYVKKLIIPHQVYIFQNSNTLIMQLASNISLIKVDMPLNYISEAPLIFNLFIIYNSNLITTLVTIASRIGNSALAAGTKHPK